MAPQEVNSWDFLNGTASEAARLLLGCILEREIDGKIIRARIVETEAYDQTDMASHSYKGQTQRTRVMFGPAGYLYVYFTYGMHYCCNIVVGKEGYGAAVLIRAVEPLDDKSKDLMQKNRSSSTTEVTISNGPAKLCQALKIDKQLNGHNLHASPLTLHHGEQVLKPTIITSRRVGISQAKDVPWRFYIKCNAYVSKI